MSTATLGAAFVVVGLVAMFLMYHLWGYPFDKVTRTSAAPRWAMWAHRMLGYVFVLIYIAMMVKMVPRLWEYQVEFPARTAAHIVLGFTIGFLLLIKIAIVRFFRHFEEWMPYLGTAIMLGTIVLTGLSLPFVLQERVRAQSAPGGSVTSAQSRARVASLLPTANLPPDAPLASLASTDALTKGRGVLLDNCVKCHDLRTILAKPRTPANWWNTVERMAEKPALFTPMTEREMFEVTAYLIAITPDLQRATKRRRDAEVARDEALDEAMAIIEAVPPATESPVASPMPRTITAPTPSTTRPLAAAVDLAKAKRAYEELCGQCHDLSDVDAAPPKTMAESRAMIQRMIRENDAELTKGQVILVAAWLDAHFVKKTH
jgi:mono/diheme cytochrome c family protein/cytochrome c5